MIAEYLPQIHPAKMTDLHDAMFNISSQQTDITQFNSQNVDKRYSVKFNWMNLQHI